SRSSTNAVTTTTPSLDSVLYTGSNTWRPSFNQELALYDSSSSSTLCGGTSGVPAGSTGGLGLSNYVYSCNSKMDHYQEMVENNRTIIVAAQALQVAMKCFV